MNYLIWLVPIALGMGAFGLIAFLWSMRTGQYEDLDGDGARVLLCAAEEKPLVDRQMAFRYEAAGSHKHSAPTGSPKSAQNSR